MIVLLDTNVCIAFLNGADARVRQQLMKRPPDTVRLCSVVKAALLYGARNSGRVDHNLARLSEFFTHFESVAFGDQAAEHYGQIRSQLKREGRPISGNDLMIAAIAIASDLTVATRNQSEFRRVAGLRVETW